MALITAGLLDIAFLAPSVPWSIVLLPIANIGTASMTLLCYALIADYLPREQAAIGLAAISSIAHIAPMVTPAIGACLRTPAGATPQA